MLSHIAATIPFLCWVNFSSPIPIFTTRILCEFSQGLEPEDALFVYEHMWIEGLSLNFKGSDMESIKLFIDTNPKPN